MQTHTLEGQVELPMYVLRPLVVALMSLYKTAASVRQKCVYFLPTVRLRTPAKMQPHKTVTTTTPASKKSDPLTVNMSETKR